MGLKEQIESIIVRKPAVKLEKNELCFYQVICQYGKQVEKITTTSKPGLGIGVGIPVTKHIGIGIGRRKVKTTTKREMVWEKSSCTMVLTSNRLLFKIGAKVYEISLDSINDIRLNKDAITIVAYGTPYYFFMSNKDVKRFMDTWRLIGQAAKQGFDFNELL